MKNLITACLLLTVLTIFADENDSKKPEIPDSAVLILVVPVKSEVARNEEIDVEVYICNYSSDSIQVPPSINEAGYSKTIVDIIYRTFRIQDGKLDNISFSSSSSDIHELSYPSLATNKSTRYKFRWKCPDEDFDLLSLKFSFFIEGDFRSGQATITQKRQKSE